MIHGIALKFQHRFTLPQLLHVTLRITQVPQVRTTKIEVQVPPKLYKRCVISWQNDDTKTGARLGTNSFWRHEFGLYFNTASWSHNISRSAETEEVDKRLIAAYFKVPLHPSHDLAIFRVFLHHVNLVDNSLRCRLTEIIYRCNFFFTYTVPHCAHTSANSKQTKIWLLC